MRSAHPGHICGGAGPSPAVSRERLHRYSRKRHLGLPRRFGPALRWVVQRRGYMVRTHNGVWICHSACPFRGALVVLRMPPLAQGNDTKVRKGGQRTHTVACTWHDVVKSSPPLTSACAESCECARLVHSTCSSTPRWCHIDLGARRSSLRHSGAVSRAGFFGVPPPLRAGAASTRAVPPFSPIGAPRSAAEVRTCLALGRLSQAVHALYCNDGASGLATPHSSPAVCRWRCARTE
ncbi:hypothetical protein B0H19DRAFT_1187937 [Mycena capillaripes]|nr:hypothetical protein B0H19DRAFT_1187937 [Mycena capillaripes]